MKKIEVKQNFIDKGIGYFAPTWANSRLRSRTMMAIAGQYFGGSTIRRNISEFRPLSGDADADSLEDLDMLRSRSRDLLRNTPIASGSINTNCVHIVGPGLKLQSRIDLGILDMSEDDAEAWQNKTESEFNAWAESLDCSIDRGSNFYDIQNLVLRSTLESGDVFVLMPQKKLNTSHYGLKLQVIEADRVTNKDDSRDKADMVAGIKKDVDGSPVSYSIRTTHPGSDISNFEKKWKEIPAFTKSGRRNVIHVYEKLRPGQTRGIPYLAPVIEPLKQLGRYSAAELQAAVIGSYLTVFIQTESGNVGLAPMEPTTETGGKKTDKDYKLASGAILELAQGEKIETVDPKRPNTSFDPFVQAILRQVGVALGIPFELLIMHFTKSYSAARSAMLNAWKVFSTRREWLINHFCDIVYEAWMEEAILRGRIVAPGFLDDPMIAKAYLGNIWIGPAPGQIDPTKEVQAAVMRIDNGLSTRSEETAALSGQDWDDKITQMKKEKRIMKEINGGTSPKPVIEDPDEPDMDPNIEVDGDEESEETDTAEGENENE